MTLAELRYLATLADTQHFGRAASLCGVNQSTLSMAIRKLESDLGVVLFERSKQGVRPTTLGEQIIAQAKTVVAQTDRISEIALADQQQLGGEIKLGAIFTLGPYLLPPLIPQLRIMASQLRLTMVEAYPADLRQQLRCGELDAILLSQPFVEADVVTQLMYSESLRVVMSPNHPLAAKAMITATDLQDQSFLLLTEKQCLRQHMLAAFTPAEKNTMECSSLETLRHMIAIGLGVSILPLSAIEAVVYSSQALCGRPLYNHPKRSIYLAWRASFPRLKVIDVLRKAIQVSQWQFTTASEQDASGLLVDNNSW